MKYISALLGVAFLALVFTPVFLWERYKYRDCKKVGHSTVYCVLAGE